VHALNGHVEELLDAEGWGRGGGGESHGEAGHDEGRGAGGRKQNSQHDVFLSVLRKFRERLRARRGVSKRSKPQSSVRRRHTLQEAMGSVHPGSVTYSTSTLASTASEAGIEEMGTPPIL